MARRLRTAAVLSAMVTAALVLSSCSSGGAKQAAPPSTEAVGTSSTTATSTPSARPATFVAMLGTNPADLRVYSTTTGNLIRDLPISGVPAGLHPGQGAIYVSSRAEVFWPSTTSGATETGSVVETPVGGGSSKVVTSGIAGIPSPDGSKLLVETSATGRGQVVTGLAVFDLDSSRSTSLPAIGPSKPLESFAWLPDGRGVLAFYPGSSSCTGPSGCVAEGPAAWTIDTTSTAGGWQAITGLSASLSHATMLGPGRLPGTVAAEVAVGNPQLLTLTAATSMPVVDRVSAPGSCFSVDHGGTNFLCTTDTGQAAASSFAHPDPEVLSSAAVDFTSLAW